MHATHCRRAKGGQQQPQHLIMRGGPVVDPILAWRTQNHIGMVCFAAGLEYFGPIQCQHSESLVIAMFHAFIQS